MKCSTQFSQEMPPTGMQQEGDKILQRKQEYVGGSGSSLAWLIEKHCTHLPLQQHSLH
jgi:hypothetical protein